MMIKRKKAYQFLERLYCDECSTEMARKDIFSGRTTCTLDDKVYVCPNCGELNYTAEEYPKLVYDDKNE